jgi:hypothetical protein
MLPVDTKEDFSMKNLEVLAASIKIARGRYQHAVREYVLSHPNEVSRFGELPAVEDIKDQALTELLAVERHAAGNVTNAEEIREFEARTGLDFDIMGPRLAICGTCGHTFQFVHNHKCEGRDAP